MAKHAVHRKKKQKNQAFSFRHAVVLCLCFIGICFGLYLWYAAFTIGHRTPAVDDDDFRPTSARRLIALRSMPGTAARTPARRGS